MTSPLSGSFRSSASFHEDFSPLPGEGKPRTPSPLITQTAEVGKSITQETNQGKASPLAAEFDPSSSFHQDRSPPQFTNPLPPRNEPATLPSAQPNSEEKTERTAKQLMQHPHYQPMESLDRTEECPRYGILQYPPSKPMYEGEFIQGVLVQSNRKNPSNT